MLFLLHCFQHPINRWLGARRRGILIMDSSSNCFFALRAPGDQAQQRGGRYSIAVCYVLCVAGRVVCVRACVRANTCGCIYDFAPLVSTSWREVDVRGVERRSIPAFLLHTNLCSSKASEVTFWGRFPFCPRMTAAEYSKCEILWINTERVDFDPMLSQSGKSTAVGRW